MGSIELKMAILTGFVGGVIMVLAEGVALHRKLSRYRIHLRGLYHAKRFFRLFAEICGIAFVMLIQPVIVSMLVMSALDKFTPQFSAHVMAELHQGIQHGNLNDSRALRSPPD
jgi:cytochrome bd-type quinol oxidase subunit 2